MPEQIPDAVERQVSAYNAGDLEGFLLCFAEDVVVEDDDGNARSTGRDALRESYGRLLAEHPDQEYGIVTRIRVGSWVVDEENITGGPSGRGARDRRLPPGPRRPHRPGPLSRVRPTPPRAEGLARGQMPAVCNPTTTGGVLVAGANPREHVSPESNGDQSSGVVF
jgi:hypothetical protein